MILGDEEKIKEMVQNDLERRRYTDFRERLKEAGEI